MPSALIQCAPALLADLETRIRSLSGDMGCAVARDFSRSGPVDDAYASKASDWTKTRDEIDTSLKSIADVVKAIREAFSDADQQLSEALGPAGSSTAGLA